MHLQAIYHHSIIISFVIYTDDWVPVGYEHDILRSTWYTESSTILCCTGVTTAVCNTTSVNIYLVRVYRIQHCSCCCFRCCRCCGEKWNEKLKRENYETKQNTYENLPSHVGFGTWYRTWNERMIPENNIVGIIYRVRTSIFSQNRASQQASRGWTQEGETHHARAPRMLTVVYERRSISSPLYRKRVRFGDWLWWPELLSYVLRCLWYVLNNGFLAVFSAGCEE